MLYFILFYLRDPFGERNYFQKLYKRVLVRFAFSKKIQKFKIRQDGRSSLRKTMNNSTNLAIL